MAERPSPFRVLAAGLAWRWFGLRSSAETLYAAMAGEDEQNRMLAGISLIRAGPRSLEFIERKIDAGEVSPRILRLLPDLDEAGARPLLARVAESGSGEVAETARQCIADLDELDAYDDKSG